MNVARILLVGTTLAGVLAAALAPSAATTAPPRNWYNVTDYPTIQSAIDRCVGSGGGVVYFPPGRYVLPRSSPTLRIPAQTSRPERRFGVTLRGDGADVCEVQAPPGTRDTLLQVLRDNSRVEGLSFTAAEGDSTSPCVSIGDPEAGGRHVLKFVAFRDVTVRGGRWGLKTAKPGIVIVTTFDNCRFLANAGALGGLAWVDSGTTTLHFRSCTFESFRHTAIRLDQASGITFTDCVFEGESDDSGPFVYAYRSVNCSVTSGWFEDDAPGGVGLARHQWFVQLDRACHGFNLIGSTFIRDGEAAANARQPKILQVLGTGATACMGVMVVNPDVPVPGVVNGTSTAYIDVQADDSQVCLLGGIVRDATAYKPVEVSDRDGVMIFGGASGLKLVRLSDAAVRALPASEKGRMIYNKGTDRTEITNGASPGNH